MSAITFCGASVTSFTSTLGWSGAKSTLEINVIEDSRNGDLFLPPPNGTPVYFYFGAYRFFGLLQDWKKKHSAGGNPVYSLQCEDPRDILAGTTIILDSYSGSTFGVANILNVYGYWENSFGYGASRVNESGMPWNLVLTGIQALTNSVAGSMGGPLQFKGVSYAVDLSQLPLPLADYRVGGGTPNMGLLDLIQQVCEDGAADFFVDLVFNSGAIIPTIRVRTVSRYAQPPLGTIAAITNTNWGGTVVESDNGIETRNETTTKFLVGGPVQTLFQTDNIVPYWGHDPITGMPVVNYLEQVLSGGQIPVPIPNSDGTTNWNCANVDARRIATSLNSNSQFPYYHINELELRFALTGDFNSWMLYIQCCEQNRNALYIGPQGVAIDGFVNINNLANAILAPDLEKKNNVPLRTLQQERAEQDVFQFVHDIAVRWYGKKYWAQVPFMLSKQDPENLQITNSQEVCEGGFILPDDTPLGLSAWDQATFMDNNGLMQAFARYDGASAMDMTLATNDNSVLDLSQDIFFSSISVDQNIDYFDDGTPAVLLTANTPVYARTTDVTGDITTFNLVVTGDATKGWNIANRSGGFGVAGYEPCCAPAIMPTIVGIPLRSNILTYGPWYFQGPSGRVLFETDSTLVPWNYGSIAFMNAAALAKVTQAVTWQQLGESGNLELVGVPLCSLGDVLQAGGPNVTNLEVTYGPQGMQTRYQFRTFTDLHLTTFSRGLDTRLRKIGATRGEIRKELLMLGQAQAVNTVAEDKNFESHVKLPKELQPGNTPHPVLINSYYANADSTVRTGTSTDEFREGMSVIGGYDTNKQTLYNNSSLVSLSAITRGFTRLIQPDPTICMPRPSGTQINPVGLSAGNPIIGANLNTFNWTTPTNQTDIEYTENCMSLTGPLIVTGWGYTLEGNPTPADSTGLNFLPNALRRSSQFRVGPVDLLWDDYRGVWTSHDIVRGTLIAQLPGSGATTLGGPVNINVLIKASGLQPTGRQLPVWNTFNAPIPAGKTVTAAYSPYDNAFMVIAADC